MTFANAGTLGAVHGRRDELVAHLTRRSDALSGAGCLLYEVGGFRFEVAGSPLRA